MICGLITSGSQVDCTNINLGGTKSTAYFINYDDIDFQNCVITNGRITTLTLFSGKNAYAFSGSPTHVKVSQDTINNGRNLNFKHTVGITIFERTQAQKLNIASLVRGTFVVIVHLKGDDDDSIVVAGYNCGLVNVPSTVMDAYANGGNYVFTFSTNDQDGEFERMPVASLGTDYDDALSIIESLIVPSDAILFGDEEVLFGSELITFND